MIHPDEPASPFLSGSQLRPDGWDDPSSGATGQGGGGFWSGSAAGPSGSPEEAQAAVDGYFMGEALKLAQRAWRKEEVPIGAVIVRGGEIIARAWNQVETLKDATAHAEMLALTQAESVVDDWRLTGCDLYVTKEPCPMCAGAAVHCRIRRVIFGCPDARGGAAGGFINLLQTPSLNHRSGITSGVREAECLGLLQAFFAERRAANRKKS